jgi:hypothetical protein
LHFIIRSLIPIDCRGQFGKNLAEVDQQPHEKAQDDDHGTDMQGFFRIWLHMAWRYLRLCPDGVADEFFGTIAVPIAVD